FMAEAGVLGLLGAAIGVLAGNLAGALLNWLNFRLPPPPGFTLGILFHIEPVPGIMIGASLLVVVSLTLASIVPAVRASRLRITEALAHV
ncbi:MAG: FtsX-like permease family protein, partial [Terracidiphilus sp.]